MKKDCPATFIVPVFNVGRYLGELLDSIRMQSFADFHVIIGDDGSTDNTSEVAQSFLGDARFQYVRWEQNRGLGAVMKDLMTMVETPFWCNPGGDDRLHPDFLSERLQMARQSSSCLMVHGPPRQIDPVGSEIRQFPVFDLPSEMDSSEFLELLLYHNVVTNPSVMIRTEVTRKCLSFMRTDLHYAPDWYWWILHASQAGTILFDPTPRMDYRLHPNSLSGAVDKRWTRAEEIRRAPLLALHDASRTSGTAAAMLFRHGKTLRSLWSIRALRVFVSSKGRYHIPSVPWLPEDFLLKLVGLCIGLLLWPFYGIRERVARKDSGFWSSGIATARHRAFAIKGNVGFSR